MKIEVAIDQSLVTDCLKKTSNSWCEFKFFFPQS